MLLALVMLPVGLFALVLIAALKPRRSILVWVGFILVLSSESVWTSTRSAGVGLRIAGMGVLLLTALPRPSDEEAEPSPRASGTSFAVNGFICGLAVYVLFSTIPHGEVASLAFNLSGLVGLFFVNRVLSSSISLVELKNATIGALGTIVAAALILGVVAPGIGLKGARLRGPYVNPNSLGFAAMLLVLATVVVHLPKRMTGVLILLGGGALIWTGSRSSAVGLAIGLIVFVVLGKALKPIPTTLLLLAGVAFLIRAHLQDAVAGLPILRLTNSRTVGSDYALGVFKTHHWTGIGQGKEVVEIASTPLRSLAQGGIPALIGASVGLILLLTRSRRAGPGAIAVAAAGVAVSFFEGWPLSGWSPGLWIFVIVFAAAGRGRIADESKPPQSLQIVPLSLAMRGG